MPEQSSSVVTVSRLSAVVAALATLASAEIDGLEGLVVAAVLAGWIALPLVALGAAKDLRAFPQTRLALLVVSDLSILGAILSVHSRGSTGAIALLFIPLYLLVLYIVVGFVLLCHKDKQ